MSEEEEENVDQCKHEIWLESLRANSSPSPMEVALVYMKECFQGAMWEGDILFEAVSDDGSDGYVVSVHGEEVHTFAGVDPISSAPTALLHIKAASDVLQKIISGQIGVMDAMMSGSLYISDMQGAMMFAMSFSLDREGYERFFKSISQEEESNENLVELQLSDLTSTDNLLFTALLYLQQEAFHGGNHNGDVVWIITEMPNDEKLNILIRILEEGKKCEVLVGTPICVSSVLCTICCSRDTILHVVEGRLTIETTVIGGLVTVDNYQEAFLFAQSFTFSLDGMNEFRKKQRAEDSQTNDANIEECENDSEVVPDVKQEAVPLQDSSLWQEDGDLFCALAYASSSVKASSSFEGLAIIHLTGGIKEYDISFLFSRQALGHGHDSNCCVFVGDLSEEKNEPVNLRCEFDRNQFTRIMKTTLLLEDVPSLDEDPAILSFFSAFQLDWRKFLKMRRTIVGSDGIIPQPSDTVDENDRKLPTVEESGLIEEDTELSILLLFAPFAFRGSGWVGDIRWTVKCGGDIVRKITIRVPFYDPRRCIISLGASQVPPLLEVTCTRTVLVNVLEGSLEPRAALASGDLVVSGEAAPVSGPLIPPVELFSTAFRFDYAKFNSFRLDFMRQLQEKSRLSEEEESMLSRALKYVVDCWSGEFIDGRGRFIFADVDFPPITVAITRKGILVEEERQRSRKGMYLFTTELPSDAFLGLLSTRIAPEMVIKSGWIGMRHMDITARFPSSTEEVRHSKEARRRKRREELNFIYFCSVFLFSKEKYELTVELNKVLQQTVQKVSDMYRLKEALMFLPHCFSPVKWSGGMQYKIFREDDNDPVLKTVSFRSIEELEVNDDPASLVTIHDGWPLPHRDVGCTVELSLSSFLQISEGRLSAMRAFSKGLVKVDNLANLLSYSSAFCFDRERFNEFVEQVRKGTDTKDALVSAAQAMSQRKKRSALRSSLKTGFYSIVQKVGKWRSDKGHRSAQSSPTNSPQNPSSIFPVSPTSGLIHPSDTCRVDEASQPISPFSPVRDVTMISPHSPPQREIEFLAGSCAPSFDDILRRPRGHRSGRK